ncbi:MAG TPA: hypothetical protein PLN52_26065 [Opitutaceae bacterium]|nr:hypothetical protein [Opitutaceae bacterium]
MPLDLLEADFLGDLAIDTHGVWEVFESVRLHYPGCDDSEVRKIGEKYLARWIEKEWIAVADKPLYPTKVVSLTEVMEFLKKHSVVSTSYLEGAPSLDITETGLKALPETPNKAVQRTRFARR